MEASKLSIIVVSGSAERLQMAAMVASVGAVSGSEVRVLLSMNALPLFRNDSRAPAPPEGPFGAVMAGKKVPPFRTLLEQAVDLGDAKVHPCSMAMDVLAVEREALLPWLAEPLGLTAFLHEARDGQLLSF